MQIILCQRFLHPVLISQACEDSGCNSRVFAMSVATLDRYIERASSLSERDLFNAGFACVYIAAKYHGCGIYAHRLAELVNFEFDESAIKV